MCVISSHFIHHSILIQYGVCLLSFIRHAPSLLSPHPSLNTTHSIQRVCGLLSPHRRSLCPGRRTVRLTRARPSRTPGVGPALHGGTYLVCVCVCVCAYVCVRMCVCRGCVTGQSIEDRGGEDGGGTGARASP